MLRKTILVDGNARFHVRPASKVAQTAQQFKSMICIVTDRQITDAKKVISLMNTAVPETGELEIVTDGFDEQKAMIDMENILKKMDWR